MASLSVWDGDVEPIGSLIEVWVNVKGIPPKWADWGSIREVVSSIGMIVDLDWQFLFNSFFRQARVKILCKDPTKIPKERIYVFGQGIFVVYFKPEGYLQTDISTDGDSGGMDEFEEDDLFENEDQNMSKDNNLEPHVDSTPKEDSEDNVSKGQGGKAEEGKKSQNNHAGGSKSTRKVLFPQDNCSKQQGFVEVECTNLLSAMELGDEEDAGEDLLGIDDMDLTQDDKETDNLPDEWVFDLQLDKHTVLAVGGDSTSNSPNRGGLNWKQNKERMGQMQLGRRLCSPNQKRKSETR